MLANIREVVALCLEDDPEAAVSEFVGVQKLTV